MTESYSKLGIPIADRTFTQAWELRAPLSAGGQI